MSYQSVDRLCRREAVGKRPFKRRTRYYPLCRPARSRGHVKYRATSIREQITTLTSTYRGGMKSISSFELDSRRFHSRVKEMKSRLPQRHEMKNKHRGLAEATACSVEKQQVIPFQPGQNNDVQAQPVGSFTPRFLPKAAPTQSSIPPHECPTLLLHLLYSPLLTVRAVLVHSYMAPRSYA